MISREVEYSVSGETENCGWGFESITSNELDRFLT
jgi:hypothetical protein